MNAHDFLPPVLLELIGKIRHPERHSRYKSYEEAMRASVRNAYENDELCNVIADKTVFWTLKLREKPYVLKPLQSYLLNAVYEELVGNQGEVTIADFGGACGAHYFELRRFIPSLFRINWYVIETPQMVRSAKSRNLGNEELKFVSSLSEIPVKTDILHTSCALHYVRSPYLVIDELAGLGARIFVVNRMMLNNTDDDFITVQYSRLSSNGEGPLPQGYSDKLVSYPYTTLSRKKFLSSMQKYNYEIKWVFEDMAEIHKTGNMKIAAQGILFSLNK